MVKPFHVAAAGVCATLFAAVSQAAVVYTSGTYTQNFDSLPVTPRNANLEVAGGGGTPQRWADDTTSTNDSNATTMDTVSIPGWYLWHALVPAASGTPPAVEGGTNGHQRLRVNSPSASTGSFYSWGNNLSSAPFDADGGDRALGNLGSNAIATTPTATDPDPRILMGLRLTNSGTETMTSFTLVFDGEQWRNGGNTTADTMVFEYQIGASTIQDASGWVTPAGNAGTWSTPVNTATAAGLNGNLAANRVDDITVNVTGINWTPGTDLWLRWNDINMAGNDHGMAIDDLSFEAFVPEPGSLSLLGLAGLGLLARRRK